MRLTDVRGHKKAKNPQLEGKIQDRKSWKRIIEEAKMSEALE